MEQSPIDLWVKGIEGRGEGEWVLETLDFHADLNTWERGEIRPEKPATFVLGTQVMTRHVHLHRVHVSRRGWLWVVSSPVPPPGPPFLLSGDPQTREIFDGWITIRCSEIMGYVVRDADPGEEFGVRCGPWFGILRPEAASPNLQAHLRAFSAIPSAAVVRGQRLVPDDPDEWIEVADILDRESQRRPTTFGPD